MMDYLLCWIPLTLALLFLPIGFAWVCILMRRRGISKPPYFPYLAVFAAFGSFFLVMALLQGPYMIGAFFSYYPMLIAPVTLLISSAILHRQRKLSKYHNTAYWIGVSYLGLLAITLAMLWHAEY
jgi:hypothetical protein